MIYGCYFDPDKTLNRIKELESIMTDSDFWNDKKSSEAVINELNYLKDRYKDIYDLRKHIIDNIELLNSIKVSYDKDIYELLNYEIKDIDKTLNDLEIKELLDGPYDNCECILEIHPGAGGTESCDWANMLLRMYTRWCEKHNYKYEIINYEDGEEAGLKSVSVLIHGINIYGYLKTEKGVHRLIRISPFDSNSRRHTSFASVDITPIFKDNDIDIVINPDDIRVDVYRSTGKGGQGVNTTDSAVRITHIHNKIVVTCQNERSQIQNKETAMEVLKNKLYELELDKKNEELNKIKGTNMDINFGSQIRTYTMCPYTLVKDHRTNTEVTDVNRVLDGDIDLFINDNLKRG